MKRISLIVLLLLLAGCAELESLIGGGEVDCSTETEILLDSFDTDRDCGWTQFDAGSEKVLLQDGALLIRTGTSGYVAWSNAGLDSADVDMTVQTRQIAGPNNNAYGAICRYADENNFYVFLLSGDGYYAIGKYTSDDSQIEYLTGDSPNHFIASDAINGGTLTNNLRIRCEDSTLTMFVNGIQLASVDDASHTAGDIGVAASTFETDAAQVEFDNVRVTLP